MNHLECVHFSPLSSQGNVYTFAVLHLANNIKKLLVASLRREVICLDYQENSLGVLIPTAREITFTYLPSGAEIISIAAFNKSESKNDFVIGITIIKNSNDLHALETYLNIYCGWEESAEFNMESISQNCVNNIELKFIPYHLIYTYLVSWNDVGFVKEVVFLLSGSDNKVHVYQESKTTHTYKEVDCKEYFPEFLSLSEIIMWMDIYYFNDYQERLTSFGCESGYFRLCKISVKTNTVLFNFSTRFDNTISCVRIYPSVHDIKRPSYIKLETLENKEKLPHEDLVLNVLVVNTTLPAVFFSDVLKYGLRKYGTLPRFECVKVQSCAENADIDFDGNDEIIIAKNDKLISYKFDKQTGWCIMGKGKQFPTSILGIKYIDITGDGVKELIVLTLKGIHVLQHNQMFVQEILDKKLKDLDIPNIDCMRLDCS